MEAIELLIILERFYSLDSHLESLDFQPQRTAPGCDAAALRPQYQAFIEAKHQVWGWREIKRVLRAGGKTGEITRAFHISLRTGMRLSEALAAPAAFNERRRMVVLARTKTTGRDEVPIGRIAEQLLAGEKFIVAPNEGSVLFLKLCRQLMIKGLTYHDSRATALTHFAKKVDVMTLARISRHKDINLLHRVYYRETADSIAARL